MLINKNYAALHLGIIEQRLRGVVMEGGSRSGKTWAAVDFIMLLCATNSGLTINIVKETFAGFKTTLYADFAKRLDHIGEPNPFTTVQNITIFPLWGNRIYFMGADQPAKFHGASCDYFWINEANDITLEIFNQLEMRCRVAWWMDYNPKYVEHWIYDKVLHRADVRHIASTMLDNPYIGKWEKAKILSYEPTPENIAAGTADDYHWKVYGLGERCAQSGVVFPNVTWVEAFPDEVEKVFYGMDFGYTNDVTALVKCGANGRNLYLQLLIYQPFDSTEYLIQALERYLPKNRTCWCDSSDPMLINDLRRAGFTTVGAKKFDGCISYRIDIIKRHNLHIVSDQNFRKEQANYAYKTVNGIALNTPIDAHNHAWDAAGYACQHELRT